jgi:hypothetical protein
MERPFDLDDKDLVIIVVFLICAGCIFLFPADQGAAIVEKAFYGLFGMATGKGLSGNGNGTT